MKSLRKLLNWVFPWPSKAERKARIEDARKRREKAQVELEHAWTVEEELLRIAQRNHFAEIIARQLTERG